jgi:hypothetical protein
MGDSFRGRPPRRRRPAAPTSRSRWGWVSSAPTWMQAVAAIITPLLALLAFFGIRGLTADEQPATDRVVIAEARLDVDTLAVDGSYADLLPDSETVVVLVRLSGGDDPAWVADEAELEPRETSGERQDGEWAAGIPVTEEGVYEVSAAIIPARSGGGFDSSVLDELRTAGPDASIVKSSSETLTVGD